MTNDQKHYSDGMSTEMLMRNVLGEKYYGYASAYQNPTLFKRDVRKLVKRLRDDVNDLIASDNFKAAACMYLDRIEEGLKSANSEDQYRALLVHSLDVISILLGHHYQGVGKKVEPYFIPSTWQDRAAWREAENYFKREDELQHKREDLVRLLKSEGHTNPEIAKILNITKYRLAQILKNIREENK